MFPSGLPWTYATATILVLLVRPQVGNESELRERLARLSTSVAELERVVAELEADKARLEEQVAASEVVLESSLEKTGEAMKGPEDALPGTSIELQTRRMMAERLWTAWVLKLDRRRLDTSKDSRDERK